MIKIGSGGGDLICPYCYHAFGQRDIAFRCTGFASQNGTACKPELDEALQRYTGKATPLPPIFEGNGRKSQASCPTCHGESTYRICPQCHSTLPVDFGKVSSRLIAMIGARNSGKTVYMTVLIHELIHSIGSAYGVAVDGADDETRSRYGSAYERVLYDEGLLFDATRSAGVEQRAPLVFHFTKSMTKMGRRVRHNTILSFFDTAGEDLQSRDAVEQNTRYLLGADGIVLLLDPLQMRGARHLARGVELPALAPDADLPQNVLGRVTDLLRARPGMKQNARIKTPIAVAFAKMDTLWSTLPDNSPLRSPSRSGTSGSFETDESLDVHYEVQRLLADWEGRQIDQRLEADYENYRYFGLSALGGSPTADQRAPEEGVSPHRVGDPLLWLLSVLGVVPTTEVKR